jgi:hypothetical protein
MFRTKHYAQTNLRRSSAVVHSTAPSSSSMPSGAARRLSSQDFAWEFGWSFDDQGWLARHETQPLQCSSFDKALALAG